MKRKWELAVLVEHASCDKEKVQDYLRGSNRRYEGEWNFYCTACKERRVRGPSSLNIRLKAHLSASR